MHKDHYHPYSHKKFYRLSGVIVILCDSRGYGHVLIKYRTGRGGCRVLVSTEASYDMAASYQQPGIGGGDSSRSSFSSSDLETPSISSRPLFSSGSKK